MTQKAQDPNMLKGAFVTICPSNSSPDILEFRYNPAFLRRSLQQQVFGGDTEDGWEIRYIAAPAETITIEIEFDVSNGLQSGDPVSITQGVLQQLTALELLVYPLISHLQQTEAQFAQGLEVLPDAAPRTLFRWGDKRCLPVCISSYEIVEQIHDEQLNPIRATVAIAMRVLTYSSSEATDRAYSDLGAYQ